MGSQEDFFRQFFGDPNLGGQRQAPQPRVGAGSGVIISADGDKVKVVNVIKPPLKALFKRMLQLIQEIQVARS